MDFIYSNDSREDATTTVAQVLSFLAETLDASGAQQLRLSPDSITGLVAILTACGGSLKTEANE